jgi:5-formyltetrahydrofolate cyclo-ligase
MAVPSPTKAKLRQQLREVRDRHVAALSLVERCTAAARIAETALPLIADAKTVAVYLPIGSEVDVLPLIGTFHRRGISLALPYYSGLRAPPRFLAWSPGEALLAGPMGLRQPDPATAPAVDPEAFVVPLLGFDATGARLGYGAGYYDRAFAAWPGAKRIGVAWACQRTQAVPVEAWDVPLHAVVTEEGVAA